MVALMAKTTKVLGCNAPIEWETRLTAIALAWSASRGEPVTKSDVMRALLAEGMDRHPVPEDLIARAAAGETPPKAAAPERPSRIRQVLRVVEGGTLAVYDVPKGRGRLETAVILRLSSGTGAGVGNYPCKAA